MIARQRQARMLTQYVVVTLFALLSGLGSADASQLFFDWESAVLRSVRHIEPKGLVHESDGIAVIQTEFTPQGPKPMLLRFTTSGQFKSRIELVGRDVSAVAAAQGGVLLVASRAAQYATMLERFDQSGRSQATWQSRAGDVTHVTAIAVLTNDDVAIAGYITSPEFAARGVFYLWTARLTPALTMVWQRGFRYVKAPDLETDIVAPANGFSTSILALPDGGFVLTGAMGQTEGAVDTYAIRLDDRGGTRWESKIGSGALHKAVVLLSGSRDEIRIVRSDGRSSWLTRVTIDGAKRSEVILGEPGLEATGAVALGDGTVVVIGTRFGRTPLAAEGFSAAMMRLDVADRLVWRRAATVRSELLTAISADLGSRNVTILGSTSRWFGRLDLKALEDEERGVTAFVQRWRYGELREAVRSTTQLENSGTGFFVSDDGAVLTNEHVIRACDSVVVRSETFAETAPIAARSSQHDLALLRLARNHIQDPPSFRWEPKPTLGEAVAVFGYPLRHIVSPDPAFNVGVLSRISGMSTEQKGNRVGVWQVTAPIEPGNSGGPLLDETGAVLGVATSSLNVNAVLARAGTLPQNVNFAISNVTVMRWLWQQNVKIREATGEARPRLPFTRIAERASEFTVLIECWKDLPMP